MGRKKPNHPKAMQRAQLIMQVRCGLMTASEAARQLGVSRKTYYKWEQRGLSLLLNGLSDQRSGRPGETRSESSRGGAGKTAGRLEAGKRTA